MVSDDEADAYCDDDDLFITYSYIKVIYLKQNKIASRLGLLCIKKYFSMINFQKICALAIFDIFGITLGEDSEYYKQTLATQWNST